MLYALLHLWDNQTKSPKNKLANRFLLCCDYNKVSPKKKKEFKCKCNKTSPKMVIIIIKAKKAEKKFINLLIWVELIYLRFCQKETIKLIIITNLDRRMCTDGMVYLSIYNDYLYMHYLFLNINTK